MRSNGQKPRLIRRLLKDAGTWIELRSILRNQIAAAKGFVAEYNKYDNGDQALGQLSKAIDDLTNDVRAKLARLDQISETQIQIVSRDTYHEPSICSLIIQRRQCANVSPGIQLNIYWRSTEVDIHKPQHETLDVDHCNK